MSILKTTLKTTRAWTPGPRTIARTGFPATPDPTWGPEKAARWAAAKAFADAAPSNAPGGWQVDRVAPPAGPRVAFPLLGVSVAAGLVGFASAPSSGALVTTVLAWAVSGIWAARVNHVLVDVDSPDLSPAIIGRALAGRRVGFTSAAWRVCVDRTEPIDEPAAEQPEPARRLVVAGARA